MKFKWVLLLVLTFLTSARAQESQFFRIVGPVASTITAFSADGYMTWTNSPTNATFTVQTASSLLSPVHWANYLQVPVTNSVTIHRLYDPNPPAGMALIPAGSFAMGNCMDTNEGDADELPLHTVCVSAFYMDRYLVTKALWDEVENWATNHGYSFGWTQGKTNNHPIQAVMWYDAVKWCNARSEKEGRTLAYYTDAELSVPYRSGEEEPSVNWSSGYRLPTEAEWEKAARGGAGGHRFPWSDTDTISQTRANFSGDPFNCAYDVSLTTGFHPMFNDRIQPYTSPVGYFAPNGYGIYDMAGNVWGFCWDRYGLYSSDLQTDPRGSLSGSYRVIRGSSWTSPAFDCRTAKRNGFWPAGQSGLVGFRCALPPEL